MLFYREGHLFYNEAAVSHHIVRVSTKRSFKNVSFLLSRRVGGGWRGDLLALDVRIRFECQVIF